MALLWSALFVMVAGTLVLQIGRTFGQARAAQTAVVSGLILLLAGLLLRGTPSSVTGPDDLMEVESVPATTCYRCHQDHYESWYRTYHRTMTREATPETVKGDFANAVHLHRGVRTVLTREDDAFFMETEAEGRPGARKKYRVDRLVGSHWFQECMTRDEIGRYIRLPVSFHIGERRWVHTNGAFLAPDTEDFWAKSTVWNETCLFCHNTRPSKRPEPPTAPGAVHGYRTEVSELGISCEACHGPGAEHVRVNQNPMVRFGRQHSHGPDPTIVNPARLTPERADHVCGRCHGSHVARPDAWDRITATDRFVAGQDLNRFNSVYWSEIEQQRLARGKLPSPETRTRPGPTDGRFWGDGTPLTTAVEYQAHVLSACYQKGQGELRCLTCHTMHPAEPNHMLRPGMNTNEACYQCHETYRDRLREHTHHAGDSSGSLCFNCHMPHVTYSLMARHRSHRIMSPRIKDNLGTGKPNACNLCHLDRSLGWTQERLVSWYGHRAEPLPAEDERLPATLVHLLRDDPRTRVVVASALSWSEANQVGGAKFLGPLLPRLLEAERYPLVRYELHRALQMLYGDAAHPYDPNASGMERGQQLAKLRPRLLSLTTTPQLPPQDIVETLLGRRSDPDVTINE